MLRDCCRATRCREFRDIPGAALDLLDAILQTAPQRRWSARQILRHPFFAEMAPLGFAFPVLEDAGLHDLEVKTMVVDGRVASLPSRHA